MINKRDFTVRCRAFCDECSWDAAMLTDETPTIAQVSRAARAHTQATGHQTAVEKGTITRYAHISNKLIDILGREGHK